MGLLAPRDCPGCGAASSQDSPVGVLCAPCWSRVEQARLPLPEQDADLSLGPQWPPLRVRAWGRFEGALAELIRSLKYRRRRRLAGPCGLLLAGCGDGLRWDSYDGVVPVPVHFRTYWSRGFNQSDLLAQALASAVGLPVLRVLEQRGRVGRQAGLSEQQRRGRSGGFSLVRGPCTEEHPPRLLLIDDVCTTGSTLGACASALYGGGAARVDALVLARTPRSGDERAATCL